MAGADQQVPQLVRHRVAHQLIGASDGIQKRQLADCAVVDVRHVARAVDVHERPAHGFEGGGTRLGKMPAGAHPHDEVRPHPRIRRVHFPAAGCPADFDAHGPENVGGLGLCVLDRLGRQFANIANGHGHAFAGEGRDGGKQCRDQ
jgi:hypothetical protein